MNFDKITELGRRVYSNSMIEKTDEQGVVLMSDELAIKNLVEQTFTPNGEITSFEQLHVFNKLIVETAELEAKPRLDGILNLISDYQSVGRYDQVIYSNPKQARVKLALTSTAAGVDFVRISPNDVKVPARPATYQFGAYYNINEMLSEPVNQFRNAVNFVVEQKVQFTFNKVMELVISAKDSGGIPVGQMLETSGIDIMSFRQVENKLLRYGKGVRPVMLADVNLIDALALAQAKNGTDEMNLATPELKNALLRDIEFSQIARTIVIPTDNPFVDRTNTKVELPVNEGIMVAGGVKSPFKIRDYGDIRVSQSPADIEDERVNMKIDFKMDITLLAGEAMGFIKDTAVML